MKLIGLIVTFISVTNATNHPDQGRRELGDNAHFEHPCFSPHLCESGEYHEVSYSADLHPTMSAFAEEVTAYYCCAVRSANQNLLTLMSLHRQFEALCHTEDLVKFFESQNQKKSDKGAEVSQNLYTYLLQRYCPPSVTGFDDSKFDAFASLTGLLDQWEYDSLDSCTNEDNPAHKGSMILAIAGCKSETCWEGTVIGLIGEEALTPDTYVHWGPDLTSRPKSNEPLIMGYLGLKLQPEQKEFRTAVRCTGVNEKNAIEAWIQLDSGVHLWNILDHNCATVAMEILAAGKGCAVEPSLLLTPKLWIDRLKKTSYCEEIEVSEIQDKVNTYADSQSST